VKLNLGPEQDVIKVGGTVTVNSPNGLRPLLAFQLGIHTQ
jgi:hypothetical protein